MNKIIYILVLCSFAFGCSKIIDPINCIDDMCIDGTWEWIESTGSIAGVTINPETENQTRKLIITESRYQEFINNELIVDLEYEYVKSDELSHFTLDSLILKLATSNWYAVFGDNDNLTLREPCADCWDHTYKRK